MSWRFFGMDEVKFSQLGLLVLSLSSTSMRWGTSPIFGEILTPFLYLYIHPLPFPNGFSLAIFTLMLRLCLHYTNFTWKRTAWRAWAWTWTFTQGELIDIKAWLYTSSFFLLIYTTASSFSINVYVDVSFILMLLDLLSRLLLIMLFSLVCLVVP